MRLVATLNNQEDAHRLSSYLLSKGIESQIEISMNSDWGSDSYGEMTCRLWIYEEEQLDEALKITSEFLENPSDLRYNIVQNDLQLLNIPPKNEKKEAPYVMSPKKERKKPQTLGAITFYLLLICSLFLFVSAMTEPQIKSLPKFIPVTPITTAPLYKELMYDYPYAYEIIDKLVKAYGYEALNDLDTLPKPGKTLVSEFLHTPYWKGFYSILSKKFKGEETVEEMKAPMFEKIRAGEVWRLFTPCLLHQGLFHLFFNMIWLVVLGQQLENRLGKLRYLLFIFIVALFSNTAQYLMSGPDFLGFSGVLCGMLGFIWIRQKKAPWEGYQIEKGTLAFMAFFIFLMFGLQVISFFLEAYSQTAFSTGIANTAHLSGGFIGYFLGHLNFFSWQKQNGLT